MKKSVVKTGLAVLRGRKFSDLQGARVALLANAASVDTDLMHIVDLLHDSPNVSLERIFAPEHGFRATEQEMVALGDVVDLRTNTTIVSLYGNTEESLKPRLEHFEDIDVLLVDLPDVGSRYYTYAQTMAYCMQMAARTNTKVIVLDRPNPLGGTREGHRLEQSCRSFCGLLSVPNRHGLTIGELAKLYNQGFEIHDCAWEAINCSLEVVLLENWDRSLYFDELDLPWVMPSPNMPTLDTAIVYPGACLFEAVNISEGRGTTRPFEILGAPFIDGWRWAEEALSCGILLEGARLRPLQFCPAFNAYAGQLCSGIQIHVLDRDAFRPFRWALALIASAIWLYPKEARWRTQEYEFIDNVPAIDLLFGSADYRKTVDAGTSLSALTGQIDEFERKFEWEISNHLLY